ncbi:putative F-box domain-containing protein [Helianthus annuus]|nr:putative F-box domain-containing protein [Helianthus annuus]
MSNHIPFEIKSEIMKTLPLKLLIRLQSVCKSWKSLIHSSDFIAHYTGQKQHLLVSYYESVSLKEKCVVSLVDDDNFPQQKVCVTLPPLVKSLKYHLLIGSGSHGLLCFYYNIPHRGRAVIWNPSIRKAVDVVVPHVTYRTALGFGVLS